MSGLCGSRLQPRLEVLGGEPGFSPEELLFDFFRKLLSLC
jgi:hypothetical protein